MGWDLVKKNKILFLKGLQSIVYEESDKISRLSGLGKGKPIRYELKQLGEEIPSNHKFVVL